MAFLSGCQIFLSDRTTARRVCSVRAEAEEAKPESKSEAREKAAREREERIRQKREQRKKDLDMKEGVMSMTDLPEEDNEGMIMPKGNYGDNASGLFGWVNQNPSSKNAVYMESFKGDGGNTGEMVKQLRGRGRTEEGNTIKVQMPKKELDIYVRKIGSPKPDYPPILFVHGMLSNSWSYKELMDMMKKTDRECYAFDFPGSGYSSWPQPGVGFSFTEEDITMLIDKILEQLDLLSRPMIIVTQGYILNQYVNLWAVSNPDKVANLVLLNQPLVPSSKLPFLLQQYRIPLVAPFVAQDAVRAERFLMGGSPYEMTLEEGDRYREAYLESMMPGLALIDMVSKVNFSSVIDRTLAGLPAIADRTTVLFGSSDKYISSSEMEEFEKTTGITVKEIDNAGFQVQADYPQRVAEFLRSLM